MKAIEQTNDKPTQSGRTPFVLLLAYPITLHLSIIYQQSWLGPSLVIGLAALIAIPLLLNRNILALGILFACICLAVFTTYLWSIQTLIFWPPILIHLILGLVFLHTLGKGRTPLITWVATLIEGTLSPEEKSYTRNVTRAWVAVLLLLSVESAVLAIYAPLELWSLFTNGINYGILILTLVIEYGIRIRKFPHFSHSGLLGFLSNLTRIRFKDY
ncbi:hypothetical protein [Kaarinaea lacus]